MTSCIFSFNIFFTQAHRDEVITMVANPVVDQVISAGLGELRISKCALQITVKKFLSPGRKIRGHGCVQQLSLRPISTLVCSERFSIFILRFSYWPNKELTRFTKSAASPLTHTRFLLIFVRFHLVESPSCLPKGDFARAKTRVRAHLAVCLRHRHHQCRRQIEVRFRCSLQPGASASISRMLTFLLVNELRNMWMK